MLCSPPVKKSKPLAKAKKLLQAEKVEVSKGLKPTPNRREPKDDTEIRVESALIELSELKSKVYFEKQSIEGKLRESSNTPKHRTGVRPYTSSVIEDREEREVHHRLVVAENIMRQLYTRNKLLEDNLSKPDRDRLDRDEKLAEDLREKTQENQKLKLLLSDLCQKVALQPQDTYVEFLEECVKDNLEESKMHLHNYAQTKQLLMTNLKTSSSDSAIIKQLKDAVALEMLEREKERTEYEAKIEKVMSWQWRKLHAEFFAERKQILEELETIKSES